MKKNDAKQETHAYSNERVEVIIKIAFDHVFSCSYPYTDCFEAMYSNKLDKRAIFRGYRQYDLLKEWFNDKNEYHEFYNKVNSYLNNRYKNMSTEGTKEYKERKSDNKLKIEYKELPRAIEEFKKNYELGLQNYDGLKRKFKVYSFLAKIDHAKNNVVDFFEEHWGSLLVISGLATVVLGAGHHIGYAVRRNVETNKYMSRIALEVEKDCKISSFSTEAVVAGLGDDDKQYVAVIGKALTNGGKKQELFQANYEVPQSIYDDLHHYYTIEYKRGWDSSEVVNANMKIRQNIDGMFTENKAEKKLYHIIDDIYNTVKDKEPASYYTITNFDGLDINIHTDNNTNENELNQ